MGADELIVLAAAGARVALGRVAVRPAAPPVAGWVPLPLAGAVAGTATGAATAVGLGPLFWVFLKVGAVTYKPW